MRNHLYIRRFLNRRGFHAGAYIYAVVPDSASCTDDNCNHRYCAEPVLTIADCGRVVSLDFDLDSAGDRRNSLHKLDVLIDSLTQFRDAFAIEAQRAAPPSQRKRAPRYWER